MAKKKSRKRRRSGGGPAGKPGSATKAQAKQQSKGSQKGTKSGSKKKGGAKGDSEKAGRRSLVDVAKGTSQTQRLTISIVIVVLAAVGGFFGGRSKASNTFRYSYETSAINAVADGGEPGDPVDVTTGDELALCVVPGQENPTKGSC